MNITLYQAASNVRELLDQMDAETGELPPEYEQAQAIVATKAQAVAAYMLESDRQADYVELHAKELLDRVKAQRRRIEWLRAYLTSHMAVCGIREIKSDDGTFKASLAIGRDESVEIFDAAQLPQDYLREVPATYAPDKKLITKAIHDGYDVPGAKLVKRDRLTLK